MIVSKFECYRDNLKIVGKEYRLDNNTGKIAIISHGFMANMFTVKQYAKLLASLGYVSFIFDFCGGSVVLGKSEGKTTEMSVLTEMKDLECIIEYASSLEYTDESHILLMGCSQGGFVSSLVASKMKDKIKELILFYPALCIPDDARSGSMMLAKFDPSNIPNIIHCGPMKIGRTYVEAVINMDPYEKIIGYENDVLIVHGDKDNIVSNEYIEKAKNTYNSRINGNCYLHYIKNGKHMFSRKHDKIAFKHIKNFINR